MGFSGCVLSPSSARTGSPGPLNSRPQPPPSWECGPGSLGQPDLALPLLGPGQMGSH